MFVLDLGIDLLGEGERVVDRLEGEVEEEGKIGGVAVGVEMTTKTSRCLDEKKIGEEARDRFLLMRKTTSPLEGVVAVEGAGAAEETETKREEAIEEETEEKTETGMMTAERIPRLLTAITIEKVDEVVLGVVVKLRKVGGEQEEEDHL